MSVATKHQREVTLAGGGNETFSYLTRKCLYETYHLQLVDKDSGGLADNCTVNLEVSIDNENWDTLTDASGEDVTGTLSTSGTLQFPLSLIPKGMLIRPKFVTDTTGTITVTSFA